MSEIDFGMAIAELITDLTDANWQTGKWDGRRFNLCKQPFVNFTNAEKEFLYVTEKMSRSAVEKRAVCRNKIETLFHGVVQNVPTQNEPQIGTIADIG